MYNRLFREKEFNKKFLTIAIPVSLQSFFSAALNMIDTIMVGGLGDTQIAAINYANQIYFIINLFLLGVSGGASIFASQMWGKKDEDNIKKILGLSLLISISTTFLLFLFSFIFPNNILAFFSEDPKAIMYGSKYLRLVSISYLFTGVEMCFSAILRSVGIVKLPTISNIIGIVLNTCLNYILIFGHFGFPKLGVSGAAIATVTARLIQMTIVIFVSYRRRYIVAATISELVNVSGRLFKRYLSTSGTLIIKDVTWALGTVVYMRIYGRMGTDVAASISIVTTIKQLVYVAFSGISNAALIIVGNEIGAVNNNQAFRYSKKFLGITLISSLVIALLVTIFKDTILIPFNMSDQISSNVIQMTKDILNIFSLTVIIESFNSVMVVGVLRSGGDTLYILAMDLFAVWIIGLPLGFLGANVLAFPIEWVYALISLQEIFKSILLIKRYLSKKWIKNVTLSLG